jgi:NAD(P)H-hydrate epimerase
MKDDTGRSVCGLEVVWEAVAFGSLLNEYIPPMLLLTREQSRAVDWLAVEQYGMSGLVLMENAGRGCAELLLELGIAGRVAICCGGGNNGGDGFVIARHLENAGVEVEIGLFADEGKLTGDAAANLRIVRAAGTPLRILSGQPEETDGFLKGADWIVDALLGTGVAAPVRDPLAGVIAAINRQQTRVLAIDLPSGLDCDTGQPWGACVRATQTATMVALKQGFVTAGEFTGEVHVIGIGIPRRLLTAFES